MLDPIKIASLEDQEARDLLAELAAKHYGTDRWKTNLARDTGYSREAVANWYRPDGRPPPLVIMWLEVTLQRDAMAGTFKALRASLDLFGRK